MIKRVYLILFFISFILACSGNKKPNPANNPHNEVVSLVYEKDTIFYNWTASILTLKLNEQDLPNRQVMVRAHSTNKTPKGALIMTAGGFGNDYLGAEYLIRFAIEEGLEVFEIKWLGQFGWGTNTEGKGYPKAVRAYTDIVKWLKENRISNGNNITVLGASGGSFQIAYGLTRYGLEKEIQHVILTAGPPTSSLERAIFSDTTDVARWPDEIGGLRLTDYMMGWYEKEDYCKNNHQTPPDFVYKALDSSSILSKTQEILLSYPFKINFVNTDDETNADDQGRLYYDAIKSEKEWHYLPNQTSHNVPGKNIGGPTLKRILKKIVNKTDSMPEERFLEVDGTKLRYEVEGQGIPCLVLGSSVYYPRTFSSQLKEHLKMYFVDLKWFAKDYLPENLDSVNIASIVQDVEDIQNQLGLDRPLIMGHSIHGTISMEYVKKYQKEVRGLVMIGSPSEWGNPNFEKKAAALWETASNERKKLQEQNWGKTNETDRLTGKEEATANYNNMSPQYWYNPTYDATWLWDDMTVHSEVTTHLFTKVFNKYNMFDPSVKISIPVLTALGKYDYVIPYTLWNSDYPNIPDFRLVLFEKSGHTPQLEESQQFDKKLLDWIDQKIKEQ